MAWCLMAPSHYLNQCWLLISDVCSIHLTAISQQVPRSNSVYWVENYISKIIPTSPRGQWVKRCQSALMKCFVWWPIMCWFFYLFYLFILENKKISSKCSIPVPKISTSISCKKIFLPSASSKVLGRKLEETHLKKKTNCWCLQWSLHSDYSALLIYHGRFFFEELTKDTPIPRPHTMKFFEENTKTF